jgi:putative FmdB family regulatory protein
MPLYEYQCDACGQRFEVIQKFSETADACRKCGKGPVHRLLSSPAIQFKGTGWYITDYAQKGKPDGSSGSDSKSTTPADTGTSSGDAAAKTETKSETTSEKTTSPASSTSTPAKSDS